MAGFFFIIILAVRQKGDIHLRWEGFENTALHDLFLFFPPLFLELECFCRDFHGKRQLKTFSITVWVAGPPLPENAWNCTWHFQRCVSEVRGTTSFSKHFMQLKTQRIDSYDKSLPKIISVLLRIHNAYTYTASEFMQSCSLSLLNIIYDINVHIADLQ